MLRSLFDELNSTSTISSEGRESFVYSVGGGGRGGGEGRGLKKWGAELAGNCDCATQFEFELAGETR